MVMPPKGSRISGDVTSLVTNTAVMSQDRLPVHKSAHSGSSIPVKQERTAAPSFKVNTEVYVKMEPEHGTVNTNGGQTQLPSRMSLLTQVDRDLSYTEGSSLALPQGTDDNSGPCLEINPTKPMVKIVSQVHSQLQLARSHTSGRARVAPPSDEDLVVFELWVDRVGLENLPQVQPQTGCLHGSM